LGAQQFPIVPWPPSAKEYVPELKPIFIAQKVPLNWSGWRKSNRPLIRRALSPAGAAGLFQLMPDTAETLRPFLVSHDQRYQPEPSTAASAQYLKSLNDRVSRTRRLALAAYNAAKAPCQRPVGPSTKTHSYDDHRPDICPAETQM